MTLEEEVELLKEKRDLLIEIAALEPAKVTSINADYPSQEPVRRTTTGSTVPFPSSLNDVDPFVRNFMLEDSCYTIS